MSVPDSPRVRLFDNQDKISVQKVAGIPNIRARILDKSLSELEAEPDFFVFGDRFRDAEDFTRNEKRSSYILRSRGEDLLATGNVMGFFGCGDERLSIVSRFARGDGDYFLQYLLKRVLDFPNFIAMQTDVDPSGQLFDWGILLFQRYLKDAMRKGLYKQYVIRRYNERDLRGVLDIPRHIAQNTPFLGRLAYNRREFSYDNDMTQLIRHTIEYIRRRGQGNLLSRAKDEVRDIVSATPGYRQGDRRGVIEANLRNPVDKVYYWEYRGLQRLCLMILRHQMHRYGGKGTMYGLLFDGAWLWEEYLNTLIGDRFRHPSNKHWTGVQLLARGDDGDAIQIVPDFISREEPRIIADAKYKRVDSIGDGNGDIFQMLSYMFRFDAGRGYFLYPESASDKAVRRYPLYRGLDAAAAPRDDVSFTKLGLVVPDESGSYDEFAAAMRRSEQKFLAALYGE